jgi:hypothetical protein
VHFLCRCYGHQPAPHAILMIGRAINRCRRCRVTLTLENGSWGVLPGVQTEDTQQLLLLLEEG